MWFGSTSTLIRKCTVTKMTLEELKKLIADDEGETVEVKETTGQRVDACETLCAFLNKDGGTVTVWYDFLSAA